MATTMTPMRPDTAYMPVPRCDGCGWWRPFDDQFQPATVGGIVDRLMSDDLLPPAVLKDIGVRLGDCALFECRNREQVHDESQLTVTRTRSGEASVVTQGGFGCVQWKEKEEA